NAYGIFVEKLLRVTKKISVVLEGGYEIESLANSNLSIASALEGERIEFDERSPGKILDLKKIKKILSEKWDIW
ncbi:MAG: hypothetical protein ACE5HW_05980, partial [Candidatus Methanofastidiosia archaeon]